MPRAILSVHDKSGLVDFARGLTDLGWELVASGGTSRVLRDAGLAVTEVSTYTGSPEILGGRVKTLHPAIHGGLLARASEADKCELHSLGWDYIDLVAVNLYPFEATISRPGATLADAVENIDIGGVTLIRAAAKNFERVALLCDPQDYSSVLAEIQAGEVSPDTRRNLAVKGFALTTRYDASIASYLGGEGVVSLNLYPVQSLRYGENPHQSAGLYSFAPGVGPLGGKVLQGKELSYNNLLDLDAAWRAVVSFEDTAVCIVKHLSPCGMASAEVLEDAYRKALASDPISAFGGIVACNRPVDSATAAAIKDLFVECIIAPGFSSESLVVLASKKNCRLMEMPDLYIEPDYELRSINRGVLRQSVDFGDPAEVEWKVVSEREPTVDEWKALHFAWNACQHVKSNAIVFAQGTATVGIGGGQPNRVDSVRIAVQRAGVKARGAVMASDAFFPFADSVQVAGEAGVMAVVTGWIDARPGINGRGERSRDGNGGYRCTTFQALERGEMNEALFNTNQALTFDDLLIVPGYSELLPSETEVRARLTPSIQLNIPLLSAAMDTVTEARLAIALAREGGIGMIHRNLAPETQASEVDKVKRSEAGMITNPVLLSPDATLREAEDLMARFHISGVPIVNPTSQLVGILTNRDIRFAEGEDLDRPVRDFMTGENLVTAKVGTTLEQAKRILQQHRIEKLPLVDDDGKLVGLITVKDIQKKRDYPNAAADSQGRLLCGAAVGVGSDLEQRIDLLTRAGVDVVVVDTSHGHSAGVLRAVRRIKSAWPNLQVIAGNVVTEEGTLALIDAGADAVKVGIGAGSICTTRIVSGAGMPQMSAIFACARAANNKGIPVIADGGIKYPGDMVKAIVAGAETVMLGSLLAGLEEAPGEVILYEGRQYKSYRGMGSLGALQGYGRDRYATGQDSGRKLVPEGVEGMVPFKGSLTEYVYQLVGGLRSGMGYAGAKTLDDLRIRTRLVSISNAGLQESHPHSVTITREAPNYQRGD